MKKTGFSHQFHFNLQQLIQEYSLPLISKLADPGSRCAFLLELTFFAQIKKIFRFCFADTESIYISLGNHYRPTGYWRSVSGTFTKSDVIVFIAAIIFIYPWSSFLKLQILDLEPVNFLPFLIIIPVVDNFFRIGLEI